MYLPFSYHFLILFSFYLLPHNNAFHNFTVFINITQCIGCQLRTPQALGLEPRHETIIKGCSVKTSESPVPNSHSTELRT